MGCSVLCAPPAPSPRRPPVPPRCLASSVAPRRRRLFKPLRCGYRSLPYQLASRSRAHLLPKPGESTCICHLVKHLASREAAATAGGGWNEARILLTSLYPGLHPSAPQGSQPDPGRSEEGPSRRWKEENPGWVAPRAQILSRVCPGGLEPPTAPPWAPAFPSAHGDNEGKSFADW